MVSDAAARRYLWTDAYAVHACPALHHRLPEDEWLAVAHRLLEQAHRVLGRHRSDDARSGWISGLDEAEGPRHPTAGGLRIGKPLPERTSRDAERSLRRLDIATFEEAPAERRLAFRELGLAIGLAEVERLAALPGPPAW